MINGGMPETPDNWIEQNPTEEFWPIDEETENKREDIEQDEL